MPADYIKLSTVSLGAPSFSGLSSSTGSSSLRKQSHGGQNSRIVVKPKSAESSERRQAKSLEKRPNHETQAPRHSYPYSRTPKLGTQNTRRSLSSHNALLSSDGLFEESDSKWAHRPRTDSGHKNPVSESQTSSCRRLSQYSTLSIESIPEDQSPVFEDKPQQTKRLCVSPPAPKVPVSLLSSGPDSDQTSAAVEECASLTPVLEEKEASKGVTPDIVGLTPIVKFRRMARAVLMVMQVCNVCKELLYGTIKKEPWFALIDNVVATTNIQQKRKGPRAFVTFVPNENRELVQLTFDVAEFKRDHRTEFPLTDEIREMMCVLPGYRRPEQIIEILRWLKTLSKDFANYSLPTQKKICQYAFYDKYRFNRVILKKGHLADGIYFVLSGSLIEKHDSRKHPKEITVGEKFGENDLLCGKRRKHTVLTRTDTELFYLHRQDYRVIFNMSEDALNPKNLEICKQHIVFQHFPMQRLVENPGVWSVINYKYGQLIALDLNTIDWIYVIKSGEARVLKYLQPGMIDVKARRRKVQAMINSQSPFYRKKRILNFVEEREYIRSAYRPSTYHPLVGGRASARSAPPSSSIRQKTSALSQRTSVSLPSTRQGPRQMSSRKSSSATIHKDSCSSNKPEITLPKLVVDDDPTSDPTTTNNDDHKNDDGNKGDDSESRPATVGEPVVIIETVEELNGDMTSRSERRNSSEDRQCNEEESGRLTSTGDRDTSGGAGDRGRQGSVLSFDGDRGRRASILTIDGSKLNADSPSERKTLSERRLSRHSQGGLFKKPQAHGQRRQTIFAPTEDRPEGFERRQSIPIPPADVKPKTRGRSGSFLKTPLPGSARSTSPNSRRDSKSQVIQVGNHTLPAFVQVETLYPGQVFGLRACLDEEERGPSVSLVSGECEVLQINKKFFMRHCDDAIYSLIRLKNKPFPSEEDLIDRLDINMQWEEYKQQTLSNFLKESRRSKR